MNPTELKQTQPGVPIAIIGMGCFFPKSSGLKPYWRLLLQGKDAITEIPESHWSIQDYFDPNPKKPDHLYCRRGGFLSPVSFDPVAFGIPPSALEATDTSQILGLMAAKLALDDAGYGNGRPFDRDRTSVILGVTGTQEMVIPLSTRLSHPLWRRVLEQADISPEKTEEIIEGLSGCYVSWQENSFPGLLGNVVAGRISNRLDLGGTNCVVDAACASSMSAIHLAVMELASGRNDMVVTGGVDTLNDVFMHMCFAKSFVLSSTGDARPFSKEADGTVLGEGVGLFILKRLADAERDHDRIYAVIRGMGSSSDGKSQSIYAPRAEGQAKALRMAYRQAGIDPSTVELIEAHGTGTRVGDAVEFSALRQVLGDAAGNGRRCAVGSVKSMIGHTKAAAGAAGLTKAVLALHHKVIPPTLKAAHPDPDLKIEASPFYLTSEARPWISGNEHPRRCGVSAFGFGGSNFHVVLEEYRREKTDVSWDGSVEIFAYSATSRPALVEALKQAAGKGPGGWSETERAYQAAQSRKHFNHRNAYRILLLYDGSSQNGPDLAALFDRAAAAVEGGPSREAVPGGFNRQNIFYEDPAEAAENMPGKIAFLFPGQGSQYAGMGRDLACCFPEAHPLLEKANDLFEGPAALSELIYPAPAADSAGRQRQEEILRRTDIAQPAIGVVSLCMLHILKRFGLKPDMTGGHSFGELTALNATGWIDLPTFLNLAVLRGRLMASAGDGPPDNNGAMLAVSAPLDQLQALLDAEGSEAVLANRNSPAQGVLSGPVKAVDRVAQACEEKGWPVKRLPVAAAFHSRLVQSAQEPFKQALEKARIHPAGTPVFANTTAKPYPQEADAARALLAEQLLSPVDFVAEIENMFDNGARTFIEIGPRPVLSALVKSILKGRPVHILAMDASAGREFGLVDLATVLCRLASAGCAVRLDQWEEPAVAAAGQQMSVPVLGANFKPKAAANPPTDKGAPAKIPAAPANQPKQTKEKPDMPMNNPINHPGQPVEPVGDALRIIREGLKTMQALQLQTAEAHMKFLEAQSEAARTLQGLVDNTRRLTRALMGLGEQPERVESIPAAAAETRKIAAPAYAEDAVSTTVSTEATLPAEIDPPVGPGQPHPVPGNAGQGTSSPVAAVLLEVVSQLTGYPADMLGLDMDIEADLGIDSIKRVEILSTLEDRILNLPPILPEMMGTLKTLGQIVDYLTDSSSGQATCGPAAPVSADLPESLQQTPAAPEPVSSEIESALLEVVSRLTGYPADMLGLDMDIEADLGIDSIKRVEILSALEDRVSNLPPILPEMMGTLKTLGQIVDYLTGSARIDAEPQQAPPPESARPAVENMPPADETPQVCSRQVLERFTVETVAAAPAAVRPPSLAVAGKVYITTDQSGLSEAIAAELTARHIDCVLIPLDGHTAEIADGAAGLLIVPDAGKKMTAADLKAALLLARKAAPALIEAAHSGGALFATVGRLDGAFGFMGQGFADPMQGGLAGLVKTAACEWEGVRCRAFDVAPDWRDYRAVAAAVADELLRSDLSGAVEVGLDAGCRRFLELKPAPLAPLQEISIALNPGDAVVVTGGGRGITAAIARSLAQQTRARLILLGRSPVPIPEPEWLSGLTVEAEIKQAIISNAFNQRPESPAQVEQLYKRHMANREILSNLDMLKQNGTEAVYYAVDVRDRPGVRVLFDEVRRTHGQIRAIIHGAGVLEDRLIIDKTSAQFDRVFEPKVAGLESLLDASRPDPLKYLILFSSVTARQGNKGQADYAMANEVLNKMAQQLAAGRRDCRVIAVNWGPWDGGMVNASLKREFLRSGIDLISPEAGTLALLREMAEKEERPVEVVIGAPMFRPETKQASDAEAARPAAAKPLSLSFKREIDLTSFPILGAHVLDGKPVVPFALMTEWLGHGALHDNPGLTLVGIDDMRLLKGIRLEQEKRLIRILAAKAIKNESTFEVEVELRDGFKDGREVIHSRARAILAARPDRPPEYQVPSELAAKTYSRDMAEVYEMILFHGRELHGIREIVSCLPQGMMARLSAAPPPRQWMADPLRSRWIGDPLVLDSAFQMATVWCYEQAGVVSLPSYSASYRQYRNYFPEEGVTAVMEVTEVSAHKMRAEFTFMDTAQTVVARLSGYEAVMDKSLYRAFKPRLAANA